MIKTLILLFLTAISCSFIEPYESLLSNGTESRIALSSPLDTANILLINYGQSNAAKFHSTSVSSTERVNEWFPSSNNFLPAIRWATLELKDKYPNAQIYYVNYTNGGSNMAKIGVGGSDFIALTARLNAAMDTLTNRGITIDYTILNFMQGEGDCRKLTLANNYQLEEDELFDYMEANYSVDIITSHQVFSGLPLATFPYRETVRTAKTNNQTSVRILFELDGTNYEADSIHLTTNGVKEYVSLIKPVL